MTQNKQILVIDDDAGMRDMCRLVLERAGYQVSEVGLAQDALSLLSTSNFDLILSDIRMPELDGLEFLKEKERLGLTGTVIMMSAYGTIDTAIECLKNGAYDYISKPFKPDEILLTLKKAEERLRLLDENRLLREQLGDPRGAADIIYQSRSMEQLLEMVHRVSQATSPVLVSGETGTGKELVARTLHLAGPRREKPFLAINCAALTKELLESELFGHARGAFTGAEKARDGIFKAADGGTLFLDEIGELPLELQPKLLRVLQEGEVRRVGENQPTKVDVRVVTATALKLNEEVERKRFRSDLFYRLAVVELVIPPLRERKSDIKPLVEHFLKKFSRIERRPLPTLGEGVIEKFCVHDWPGNVRELENFIEKTLIFCRGNTLTLADIPWEIRRIEPREDEGYSLKKAVARLEQEYIQKALRSTQQNRTKAAKLLEISLRALHYKIKDYDME